MTEDNSAVIRIRKNSKKAILGIAGELGKKYGRNFTPADVLEMLITFFEKRRPSK
jgi:hypothetical protein